MKEQDFLQEEIPAPVRACIDQLKQADANHLPAEVERGLYQARQSALAKFAQRKHSHQHLDEVLSWVSFGHPRLMSTMAFFIGVVLATAIWTGLQSNNDAMMLGADMPIEAFADSGFEGWGVND